MDQHRGRKIPEPSRPDGTDGTGGLCYAMDHEFLFFDYMPQQSSPVPNPSDTVESRQAQAGIRQVEETLQTVKEEFLRFTSQRRLFIFVTNEIGMGGVSTNEVQRRFTDLLGWTNQFVASQADEVYLMVSGIPMKIK